MDGDRHPSGRRDRCSLTSPSAANVLQPRECQRSWVPGDTRRDPWKPVIGRAGPRDRRQLEMSQLEQRFVPSDMSTDFRQPTAGNTSTPVVAPPAPVPPPLETPRREPELGFLTCDTCERVVPYTGFADSALGDGWPMHRCRREVRPFDRWLKDDPTAPPTAQGGAAWTSTIEPWS